MESFKSNLMLRFSFRSTCNLSSLVIEVSALEKSSKKQRPSAVDVSAAQVSDVNISGVSSTPASDVAESTTARRTRRSNVPSMPSLTEIPPPPAEILPPILDNDEQLPPMVVNDDQLMQVSSSGEENIMASSSHEAMVSPDDWVY